MKKITEKWISLALYDFDSAKVMLNSRKYIYVAFMCQQAVEKYLKAYIAETKETAPPYTHNLAALAEISTIEFTKDQMELLSLLSRYYINARYPGVKEKMSQGLNRNAAENLFSKTSEIIKCLEKELKTLKK